MEKISIVPYNPSWPTLFEQESKQIRELFSGDCDIEHIGSTSVHGLDAKPVIDIMLGFENLSAPRIIERMESIGYKHWKEDAFQHVRLMFTKWSEDMIKRLINVHATVKGGEFWNEQLQFRNKLREDQVLIREYAGLKKDLARKYESDPDAYTAAKTEFVKKVLAL
ncbi:MAG: GrpB family protein [bacterium]|nr:GrpB family protein [bacterium]